jgi:uncharacterized membrane protein YccC
MTWPAALRFTRGELLFSIKSFAAAMLAMYVASRAGLPRPFWAVLTTYVVAHPLAGNVRSKALFRFCGTLIGCIATVLMVPAMSNAPELLTLALALWVGGCLYLSLLDRTARAYVFMLAGYTAALIGFPSVETPTLLFDTAVARVEEIGLGILCATIVHSLVLPAGLAPSLIALLDRSLGDARQWFTDLLSPLRRRTGAGASAKTNASPQADVKPDANTLQIDRQRLALDITQLRLLSTHVPFDTGNLRWTAGAIRAMQDQLAALTPALSAVEDRLGALADTEGTVAPDVSAALARTTQWLQSQGAGGADDEAASQASLQALQALRETLNALGELPNEDEPAASAGADWRRALRIGLAVRLDELATGWLALAALRRTIDAGLRGDAVPLRRAAGFSDRVLHRDTGLALLSSFAAVLAICLACTFWIATAWPSGAAAPMMAAVFCSFFAAMDDPVPGISGFLKFTLVSTPISALYVLVLLPLVHDFGMLVLVCAPVFLLLGCWVGKPATAPAGLAMVFGVAGTLALHDTASADLASFVNSNLAQIIGIGTAALITRAVRTVGSDWVAARIRRATWRELGAMAAAPRAQAEHAAYAVRMLDRISLLAPRVSRDDVIARETTDAGLRDLRMGADIVALQGVRRLLPAIAASRLLGGIARFFRDRSAAAEAAPSADLLGQLDDVLMAALPPGDAALAEHRAAVTALVGLRRNLFPTAPATLGSSGAGALG